MRLMQWLNYMLFFAFLLFIQCSTQYGPGWGGRGRGDGYWHMMNYGFGGWFMWIILLIIIGVAVFFIVRYSQISSLITKNGRSSLSTQKENPLDIIKNRYAKGEITKEQYEDLKNDLQ